SHPVLEPSIEANNNLFPLVNLPKYESRQFVRWGRGRAASDWRRAVAAVSERRVAEGRALYTERSPAELYRGARSSERERYARQASRLGAKRPARALRKKTPRAGGPARGDRRSGLHRLLGHELQRHRREFFHRLLFDDPHRVLHRQPAHLLGLLRDRRGHRPRLDRRQRVADGVKAYDEHLFLPLRGRNGLDGAQRHFVVLREDRVDLLLRLQDVLHDRQALGTVEVRGLHGDQPDTGIRLQTITKTLAAVARGRGPRDAFQHHHAALPLQSLGDVLRGHLPAGDVVGRD